MIVGEAPGNSEVRSLEPFTGVSGQELTKMLHEAGIIRTECFITNVCKYQPPGNRMSEWLIEQKTKGRATGWPERYSRFMAPQVGEGLAELAQEIERVKPNLIIALGATALWALTGETAITKWRGSMLETLPEFGSRKLIPTYHPAAILRMWSWRFIAVHDLRRCEHESDTPLRLVPKQNFLIRPSFETARGTLSDLILRAEQGPLPLSVDIETRAHHIACIGFAWTNEDAICIPLMCVERPEGYWSEAEEGALILLMKELIEHPNVRVIGQNFLYDLQYLIRYWGIWCEVYMDTMLAHHTCFPGTQKGLDYLSSLYCANYTYWKDEGKEWDASIPEEQMWVYNCKDCINTFEVAQVLERTIDQCGLRQQWRAQMALFTPVLKMMLRGVNIDKRRRQAMSMDLLNAITSREEFLTTVTCYTVPGVKSTKPWWRSPQQAMRLFYGEMGFPVQKKKGTGKPTADANALTTLAKREPLLLPIVNAVVELRSLGVFLNTFVKAPLDSDGRMRCSYNIAGTETFRFSSSANAFGSGTNLQNIPAGNEDD